MIDWIVRVGTAVDRFFGRLPAGNYVAHSTWALVLQGLTWALLLRLSAPVAALVMGLVSYGLMEGEWQFYAAQARRAGKTLPITRQRRLYWFVAASVTMDVCLYAGLLMPPVLAAACTASSFYVTRECVSWAMGEDEGKLLDSLLDVTSPMAASFILAAAVLWLGGVAR